MNVKTLVLGALALPVGLWAQPPGRLAGYDITKERVLYTVGYTHLDSEYEWDYKTTVTDYLKNTMAENYRLFDKYPDYVYSFTGSRRYRLMKEYHPELYKRLKGYIDQGRWNVAGSSVDEDEVNISSPESVLRQILYGNNYFRSEFGKESVDYMLPDCFGFVACLPSVLYHAGLLGFSTQKLTIESFKAANPVPFNIGVWNGPDGKGVVACLDATDYDGDIFPHLDLDSYWDKRLADDYSRFGISFDYRYYGCGDMGGGLRDRDVIYASGSLNNPDSKFKVIMTSSDQMFRDITPAIRQKLPVYTGDLLLIEHSAGSMTSQSYMKRLNRKNEILAQSSEEAACMAWFLCGSAYPTTRLNNSWELVLGSQMHDVLPGTAIPNAFKLAWNDEFIAQNGFTGVLKNGLREVISKLNTQTKGRSIAVYNPLACEREDICTAEIEFATAPAHVRIFDANGKETPSQVIARKGNKVKFIFVARTPSLGLSVYDVRESDFASAVSTSSLSIEPNTLENEFYKVTINDVGDISGIIDKKQKRELLQKPARLEFQHESPRREPAWNMFWYDRQKPPFAFMDQDVTIRMIENGPVRVAFEVTRKGQNSAITQIISLAAGEAGKRVEVANILDWQSTGVSLKASFPFTAENDKATYNLGVGTIQQDNNRENKFEVPSKKWFDLTDRSGRFGVTVLEDCRYGSDKPDNHTVRLTLEYTPSADLCPTWLYQATQDWGIQHFKYGLYSHNVDWSDSETQAQADYLNTPLIACEVPKHTGKQGTSFSFLSVSNPRIGLMALKKAEHNDYLIVRVNELSGKDQTNVSLRLAGNLVDAYEVNGQEQKIGNVSFSGNKLNFDLSHYTIKSFAIKLATKNELTDNQMIIPLDFDQDVMSFDDNRTDGDMARKYDPTSHGDVKTYPAEMVPSELISEGIRFKLGSTADLQKNALTCKGQIIKLPEGKYNKLYLLASATDETTGTFLVGGKAVDLNIAKWIGFIGQHYDRQFGSDGYTVVDMKAPFLKHDDIAWFASHYHFGYPGQNVPYTYSYMFKYEINLPANATEIVLPDNDRIKLFALTVAHMDSDDIQILQSPSDNFQDDGLFVLRKNNK
jgi:alpha-mannosidase